MNKTELKAEAARLLSMEPDEIYDVAASDSACAVRTLDGNVLVITGTEEDGYKTALLVKPRPTFHGFPVMFGDLDEATALKRLGVKLDDPRPRPADPSIPEGSADGAFASPGEAATSAAALAGAAAGDGAPVDAPGPEHAEAVAESYTSGSAEGEAEAVEEALEKATEDTPATDAAQAKAERGRRRS